MSTRTASMTITPHGTFTYYQGVHDSLMVSHTKQELLARVRETNPGTKYDGRMAKHKLAAMVADWHTATLQANAEAHHLNAERRRNLQTALADARRRQAATLQRHVAKRDEPTFYSVTTTYPYAQDTVEAIVLGHVTRMSLKQAASLLFALVDGSPDPDFPGHAFHMTRDAIEDSLVRGYLWDESGIAFRPDYGPDGHIASVRVFPVTPMTDPQCVRAVGIARCQADAAPGSDDCGNHDR